MKNQPQTIFRRALDSNFVTVGNELARNPALSHRARGILLWLLSYPKDWDIRLDTLTTDREGPAAVRAAIEELEDAGFVVRDQMRQERGRFGAGMFRVYDSPVPESERSGSERRSKASSDSDIESEDESADNASPYAISPYTVPPQTVPPHAVTPFAANRTLQKQSSTKTESTKTETEPPTDTTHARTREIVQASGQGESSAPLPAPTLADSNPAPDSAASESTRPNIFGAWERVAGPLTGQISDALQDAVRQFGEPFVTAAIEEMGISGARPSLKYLQEILDTCQREKRSPGQPRPLRPPAAQQAAKRAATEDPENWAGKASNLPPPSPVRSAIPPGWTPPNKEKAS